MQQLPSTDWTSWEKTLNNWQLITKIEYNIFFFLNTFFLCFCEQKREKFKSSFLVGVHPLWFFCYHQIEITLSATKKKGSDLINRPIFNKLVHIWIGQKCNKETLLQTYLKKKNIQKESTFEFSGLQQQENHLYSDKFNIFLPNINGHLQRLNSHKRSGKIHTQKILSKQSN